ncbi:AraC family transcriptional regulator [Paenibacillus sp. GSMTC-2017]|nr:AraC family transcriptional regulator [Paenibacillus sp. GSMTC-2017]
MNTIYRIKEMHEYIEQADRAIYPIDTGKDSSIHMLIVTGAGSLHLGGRHQSLNTGDVLLLSSTSASQHVIELQQGVRLLHIQFNCLVESSSGGRSGSYTYLSTIPEWIGGKGAKLKSEKQIVNVGKRLFQLREESNGCDESDSLNIQALFYEMLLLCREGLKRSIQLESADWYGQAVAYIRENYQRSVSLSKLASIVKVSPDYLSRRIKEETGSPYSDFMSKLRIRKAQELLLGKEMSVGEAALAVGFKDSHYLSRKFKQVTGYSPTAYIKKNKTIVSLEPVCTSMLLTLGSQPLMAGSDPWMKRYFQMDLARNGIHTFNEQDVESKRHLATVRSDLRIGYEDSDLLELSGRASPYIKIDWRKTDWRDQFRHIGDLVGKYHEAETWLSRFEERASEGRELIHNRIERGATFAVFSLEHADLALGYVKLLGVPFGRGAHIIYQTLGFSAPQLIEKEVLRREGWLDVPLDEIQKYAADYIVVIRDPAYTYKTHPNTNYANQHLAWRAVINQAKATFEFSFEHHHFDPVASDIQLSEIVKKLTADLSTKR